jgi:hypothetical protein
MYSDPNDVITIMDFQKDTRNSISQYQITNDLRYSLGFRNHPVWIRFQLKNLENRQREFYLVVKYPLLDEVTFFQMEDQEIKSKYEAGRKFPFKNRHLHSRNFVFPFLMEATSEVTFVIKAKTDDVLLLPIRIVDRYDYISQEKDEYLFSDFSQGHLLLWCFIIYSYIFLFEREVFYFIRSMFFVLALVN